MLRRLFQQLAKLVRYLTTARDNQTPSLTRIFTLLAAVQWLGLAGWAVVFAQQPFDPVAYGSGFGLMITGFAVALRVGGKMNAGNDDLLQGPGA
jgi:hypothetical protein